ncbi:MAG TPA: hypothetical protein VGW57_15570 [Chthoniobacterales bacterium]|nr:hypothetical protein [Chthoniobacterales bacterium]
MLEANRYRKFRVWGIPINKGIILALALTVLGSSKQLRAEDLESVLRAPARYNQKRVSLTGVLVGDRSFLELFRNASDAKEDDERKCARLVVPDKWQQSAPYDMRLARAVGIVDAGKRGDRDYPFELKLENLVVLSGPVVPWQNSVMVLYNDTQAAVLLRVGVAPTQTELLIPPKKHDGFLSLELEYSTVVQVMTSNRKPIFENKINVGPQTRYYDAKNGACYFRIRDKKIERVSPAIAANWGWKR